MYLCHKLFSVGSSSNDGLKLLPSTDAGRRSLQKQHRPVSKGDDQHHRPHAGAYLLLPAEYHAGCPQTAVLERGEWKRIMKFCHCHHDYFHLI